MGHQGKTVGNSKVCGKKSKYSVLEQFLHRLHILTENKFLNFSRYFQQFEY